MTESDRREWLAERRKYVCGSDIPSIMGIGWRTPFDIYCEKRGLVEDAGETEEMRIGRKLEHAIIQMYAHQTHKRPKFVFTDLWKAESPALAAGSPDAYTTYMTGRMRDDVGIEAKNVGTHRAKDWGPSAEGTLAPGRPAELTWDADGPQGVPLYVWLQAQWYMLVSGFHRWDVAVLFGGNRFRIYICERDDWTIAVSLQAAHDFWFDCVHAQEPPPMQGRASEAVTVKNLNADCNGAMLNLGAHGEDLALNLKQARDISDSANTHKRAIENEIKSAIGNNVGMEGPWGEITWKPDKRGVRTLRCKFE